MKKYLLALAAAGTVAAATPSFAEYYIVQQDHDCKVVETRPADTTWVQVGPLSLATRDEAEREMRVVCKDFHHDGDTKVIIEKK